MLDGAICCGRRFTNALCCWGVAGVRSVDEVGFVCVVAGGAAGGNRAWAKRKRSGSWVQELGTGLVLLGVPPLCWPDGGMVVDNGSTVIRWLGMCIWRQRATVSCASLPLWVVGFGRIRPNPFSELLGVVWLAQYRVARLGILVGRIVGIGGVLVLCVL